MLSLDRFTELLDDMVPYEVQQDLLERNSENYQDMGIVELLNLREQGRTVVLKEKISSTHKWHFANCIDSTGNRVDCFWCEVCGIRASSFDYISCISIISKVRDTLPTYSTHNQYIMLTCDQVLKFISEKEEQPRCIDCGMPENCKTEKCHHMIG